MIHAFAAASLLALTSVLLASCTGGGIEGQPPGNSSSSAPQNVAATAGFHSTHLAWDPVPNATSYKIYPAGSAGVSSSTITPITVSASPYNGTSLPNWVAVFYRVSAVVGGQESPLSTEVSATPTAGYLVGTAFEANQFRVDVFHADELGGAALRSIPGAIVLARVDGVGLLYGVDCSSPLGCAEMGLFTASAQRIVLAANAGHFFGFVSNSLIGDRLVIRDSVSGTNRALVSFAKDGSDPRTLVSGCSVLGNFMTGPGCLLFRCNNGSGPVVWASDGAAPAVALPLSVNAVPRATDGQNALLVNGATGRLTTQRTDGSGTPKNISPDGAAVGDALLAAIDSTALLMTQTPDNFYDTWTIPFDGSGLFHPHLNGAGSPLPGLTPVTADHRHFVVTYPMDAGAAQWRTFLVPVDASDMNFINLTPAGASVFGAALFEDGNALVQRQNVGWQVMQVGSSGATAGPVLDGNTVDYFLGTVGRYAVFQDASAPYPIHAAREDGAITTTLAATGNLAVPPVLLSSGRILYVDSARTAWVAEPDLSLQVALDAGPVDSLYDGGRGDGNREFYVTHRFSGLFDTFVLNVDSRTVDRLLGHQGYFLP